MALRSATLEPVGQALLDDVVGDLLDSRSAQELGLWHCHLDRGHQALLDILFGRPVLIFLGQFGELPGVLEEDVVTARVSARSKPAMWVPPWVVGMVFTNDWTTLS